MSQGATPTGTAPSPRSTPDRRFGALEVGRLERSPGAQMARSCAAWSGAAAPAQPGARERDRLLAAGLRCAELRGSVASGTADRCSDVTSAGLCQMRCSRQPSNPPQGGPIRVCGGIATHRPRPRSVRPPQDHLPLAGGHSAVLARRSRHPCNLRGSRRRLRCGNPRPRAANRDGRSQAAPWRPGLLRALPHRVRLWY